MKKIYSIISFCLLAILPEFLPGQTWSGLPGATGGEVKAMAVYNNQLYMANNDRVSIWTGTGWTIAGTSGMSGNSGPGVGIPQIGALAVYNGELYAAGNFAFVDGNPDTCIARWNGFTWSDVPGSWGFPPDHRCGDVYSLGVSNNLLYAGGFLCGFQNYCIKWDGSSCSPLPNFSSTVTSLCEYNGVLYVGNFNNGLSKYVNNSLQQVGTGCPVGIIYSMTVFNNELYVGGNANGGVAKWNGSTWTILGSGVGAPLNNLIVSSIAGYAGEVYVTGDFTTAGGNPANNIAKWNGTNWSALGSGLNGQGSALAVYNGDLCVGGLFSTAGGNLYVTTAKWNMPACPSSITAGGLTTICQGTSVTLNANPGIGFNYQWKLNGTTISGATSSSYPANSTGIYSCVVTNGCSSTSNTINVTVNPIPSATITPNGNLNFCTGSGISLQANTGAGLTYQWRKNGVNINGATSSSYLANSTANFNVIVTNSSGCSKGATSVNVTGPPSNTVSALGPTHFCTGGNVTLKSVSGQTVTYKWKKNGAYISGATSQTYVATSTGSYNCIVTNSFGCSKGGTAIAVTGPPSAVITANGPTTFCAGGSVLLSAAAGYTYQWIKNSVNIGGATSQNYSATTAGNYKVTVTDPFGCSKTTPNTNQITVSVPCRKGNFSVEHSNNAIKIFPNPAINDFTLSVDEVAGEKISFYVYDVTGKVIFYKENISSGENIKFGRDFSAGVYFAEIIQGSELQKIKIIKIK